MFALVMRPFLQPCSLLVVKGEDDPDSDQAS